MSTDQKPIAAGTYQKLKSGRVKRVDQPQQPDPGKTARKAAAEKAAKKKVSKKKVGKKKVSKKSAAPVALPADQPDSIATGKKE